MEGAMDDYMVMDMICVLTAAALPLPALYDTIKAFWRRELPAGGRRPEPTVAALLGNAAWVLFGYTENQREPLLLNAWGGAVQMAGLLAFLLLCTRAERVQALRRPILIAAIYFALTLVFGIFFNAHLDAYQWICTIAGLVAAAAPLLTLIFAEDANDDMLPPRLILVFYAVHGVMWY